MPIFAVAGRESVLSDAASSCEDVRSLRIAAWRDALSMPGGLPTGASSREGGEQSDLFSVSLSYKEDDARRMHAPRRNGGRTVTASFLLCNRKSEICL